MKVELKERIRHLDCMISDLEWKYADRPEFVESFKLVIFALRSRRNLLMEKLQRLKTA